ncbi:uncharacterized protein LOC144109479 [Amblyomma americanum]
MWFVAAYGARKFSPPSSSNSEERTLPSVCGTSCFRCSQGQWKAFIVVFQIRLGHHPSLRFKYYDAMPARCALSASRTRAYSQEAPRCGVSSWHLARCDSCLRCKFVHVPCLLVLCARLFLTSPAAARYALTRAFQCFTQSARKTLQAVFQADMSGPGVSATSGARYSPACGLLCLPDVFRMGELRLCRTRHITRTGSWSPHKALGSVDVFPAQLRPGREGVVPDAYLFHMLSSQIPCAVPKAPATSSKH